ncbi:uncharacterized protein LOC131049349 isoform X2 [Cryptomeria japonica]|uniref:uncharacterized protein LOC131049349 isoform X2 n=1 Tax=Cryptomeria japonica TaxID=3369 RepID=UPI0027DA93FC|nr:uncharacterized protein LOC131049349 isoform X2 [Cryptomeria japonica]
MMQQMSSMAPPPPAPPPQGPNPAAASSPSQAGHLHPHHHHPLPHHHPHQHGISASSLSLGLVPHTASATRLSNAEPLASEPPLQPPLPAPSVVTSSSSSSSLLSRIKLADILPDDGAPTPVYSKAVEALSNSLTRHNAAVIELGTEDSKLLRVALDSAKFYFRTRAQVQPSWATKSPGYGSAAPSRPNMYSYRAGRAIEEGDSSPPCMPDVFRCLGKASRAALSAIARHLRLRSDVFNQLLDDLPLPANEVSSSALVATYTPYSAQNGKGLLGGSKPNVEIEKGLLMLIVSDNPGLQETRRNQNQEPSLRSVLSDPLSGNYLEDAFVARCGHSFGGAMLRKVYETSRCITCGTEVEVASMVPNHALRAAAIAVKNGDERRQLHNAALRKRRKEEQGDGMKRLLNKDDVGLFMDRDSSRQGKGVQYPFAVSEKVMIKGNKRTPDKFVGREAIVTAQCLNGWYMLRALDTGETVRLQYRSLQKISPQHNGVNEDHLQSQQLIASNN